MKNLSSGNQEIKSSHENEISHLYTVPRIKQSRSIFIPSHRFNAVDTGTHCRETSTVSSKYGSLTSLLGNNNKKKRKRI